jgi:hypothetical protein
MEERTMEAIETFAVTSETGRYIATISIFNDPDAPNPMEDGSANGKLYSFNRRHLYFNESLIEELAELEFRLRLANNMDPDDEDSNKDGLIASVEKEIAEFWKHRVPLSYYEHGGCRWDVAGTRSYPDAQWDSVSFAGIWEADADAIENIKARCKTKGTDFADEMKTYAQEVLDMYNKWLNGEYFGYSVRVHTNRGTEVGDGNSCWGYDDQDYCREEAKQSAKLLLDELEAENELPGYK